MNTLIRPWITNPSETSWQEVADEQERMTMRELTFDSFSEQNLRRCEHPKGFNHRIDSWDANKWAVAVLGELGEAANIIKKLNRVEDGIPGNSETPEQLKAMLADELADAFIYLDLLVQSQGLRMDQIVLNKFHKTSKKIGYELEPCPLCATGGCPG